MFMKCTMANMADPKISIILVLGFAVISVSGLSCSVCNPNHCNPNHAANCQAGFVKDVCGCCNVCAKRLAETCGGPWNIDGVCGTNLKCEKQPEQGIFSNAYNTEGTCVLENPVINPNWVDGFDLTGMVGIKFSGFIEIKITIKQGITYFNGIEIGEGKKDCYKACNRKYLPVCGSDGDTYVNECALLNEQCGNQNIKLTQHAPCDIKPPVVPVFCFKAICTEDYKPVCGSDGKTYYNECQLNNAKCDNKALRKVHDSLCVKVVVTTCTKPSCTLQYKPVCGSDEETYGNECLFNNAKCADQKLTIVSRTVCSMTTTSTTYFKISINNGFEMSGFSGLKLSGFQGYTFQIKNGQTVLNDRNLFGSQCYTCCTLNYMPVCGSDGNNYPNVCALENAKCDDFRLYKRYNGKCGDIQYPEGTTCILAKCKSNIGDTFKLCGSDGKTYDSFCDFLNAKCRNTFLELANIGSCVGIVGPIECKTPCNLNLKPVCGSNEVTYSNDCLLRNARCDNIFLYKKSDGPCDDCKSGLCTLDYFPICGSDGKTYGNECLFINAQCDDDSLQRKYNGECAEVTPVCVLRRCLEHYQAVCGSDGITYSSECHLNNAKCENNLLKLVYKGHCEILWRLSDSRCGRNYPLSSGKPAQCNPNSESSYCCSASGWCGQTDFHCSCNDCVNYKKINMDSLLLSAVIQLQGTCGHANNCRKTLQTLEQFVGLQKEHIKLLNHNDDLMSKRVVELEHQTRESSRKLTDLVAYHYECLPPFVFLEPTKECLYFHTEPNTYDQAKGTCTRQAAEMAIPEDFNILSRYMNENGYGYKPEMQPFIGARSSSGGSYVWENNTVIKSDNWGSKSDMLGLCVVFCPTCISKAPLIADSSTACNTRRPFICKKKKGNVISTSISLPSNINNNNGIPSSGTSGISGISGIPGIPGMSGDIGDENAASAFAAALAQALQDNSLNSNPFNMG